MTDAADPGDPAANAGDHEPDPGDSIPDPRDNVPRDNVPRDNVPRDHADRTDDPVDHAWVLQATFVATVLAGAPAVAVLALAAGVPATWAGRAAFAVRVGAAVWLLAALVLYAYDRWWR